MERKKENWTVNHYSSGQSNSNGRCEHRWDRSLSTQSTCRSSSMTLDWLRGKSPFHVGIISNTQHYKMTGHYTIQHKKLEESPLYCTSILKEIKRHDDGHTYRESTALNKSIYDIMMELFSTIYHKHKHLLLYRHSVVVVVFSLSLLLAQVEYYKV
jgi:hypothetical protein